MAHTANRVALREMGVRRRRKDVLVDDLAIRLDQQHGVFPADDPIDRSRINARTVTTFGYDPLFRWTLRSFRRITGRSGEHERQERTEDSEYGASTDG